MIDIEVKLSGDLVGSLDKLEKSIKQQVVIAGVAKMAQVMYDEVRLNAARGGTKFPDVISGDLLKSVYRAYIPERSTGDRKVYVVGSRNSDAFYWRFVEFGTSRMPAQPFLRPALSAMQRAVDAGQKRMAERMRELKP